MVEKIKTLAIYWDFSPCRSLRARAAYQ